MADQNIELGDRVLDRISGFEGIVTSLSEHITGCQRVGTRPVERADRGDEEWFYPAQLEVVTTSTEFEDEAKNAVTEVDFSLGERLEDEITGVSGIVSTITYQLYNCPRIALQPVDQTDTTESPDREWFDAPRLRKVDSGVAANFEEQVNEQETAATGSPARDVRRKADRE